MPVTVTAAPIPFLHTQTARRRRAAERSRRHEVGGIADRGGKSGLARVGDLAPEAELRPNFRRRANSLFGPIIRCSVRENSLFGAARESRATCWNSYVN